MRVRTRRAAGTSTTAGFTLIELLVVIGIISVLSGLGLHAAAKARMRSQIAETQGVLSSVSLGLSQYRADYRSAPKLSPAVGSPDQLLVDDCPALYAALLNQPERGGGRGAPYLKLDPKHIGVVTDRAVLAAATMGQEVPDRIRRLDGDEITDRHYPAFQEAHGPASAEPLVLLDSWGNPIHYRQWSRVSRRDKEAIHSAPPQRTLGVGQNYSSAARPPLPGPVPDRPLDPYGFDLWSAGPNGVNEYGHPDSDDLRLR